MVAILDGGRCPSCGGRHTLYLPDHRMAWLHRDFDYNCPSTGESVRVRTALWDRLAAGPPADSLDLRPASPTP